MNRDEPGQNMILYHQIHRLREKGTAGGGSFSSVDEGEKRGNSELSDAEGSIPGVAINSPLKTSKPTRYPDWNDIAGGQKKRSIALRKNARLGKDAFGGMEPLKNKGLSHHLPVHSTDQKNRTWKRLRKAKNERRYDIADGQNKFFFYAVYIKKKRRRKKTNRSLHSRREWLPRVSHSHSRRITVTQTAKKNPEGESKQKSDRY